MSGIRPHEYLRLLAQPYWEAGKPLPNQLFSEFLRAGLDADEERRHFIIEQEAVAHG